MGLTLTRRELLDREIRSAGNAALVVLAGELDVSTVGQLYSELAELTRAGVSHVTLDLSALDFLDSTGVSVIIAEHKRVQAMDGGLTILTPSRSVRRVFEITGLVDYLNIHPAANPDDAQD